ncbi:cephalosporin hydroxylase family protein [Chitinasiproducens palmae]|uniref:Cephalosporin hydroxylase n=1 Tax=Chitinasiproducens palmae TaxID=1770053 RepID=A0A1H2PKV1_9BURK|nr:CmcI family methyltransferase [Chitinasiproducens palmae]SDV47060.1 Cephalosporin hydroxylase [Chitinasiproducens palmae]
MTERISARMRDLNIEWLSRAAEFEHLFQTRWLGERFFHLPGDMMALQELIWRERPDRIIQTGIAAGGGVVFSASMLELVGGTSRVVAIEPRLRADVRARLLSHRLAHRMRLVEGASCTAETLEQVRADIREAGEGARVMAILDLNHTHDHVLAELQAYSGFVTPGNYVIVMDTIMEYLPESTFVGKPYGKGNNPATAAAAFLAADPRFEVDQAIEDRVIMTLSPDGFLKRVR